MKKRMFLTGIFSILLVFGLVLVGCKNDDDDGGSSTGTLTIRNSSTTANEIITSVTITDSAGASITANVSVAVGQTYTKQDLANGTYVINISTNRMVAGNGVTINGEPKTLVYDGRALN